MIFDLDDDGDLDIVTNEFNAPPQILISDLAAKTKVNRLVVELEGTRSNRDGLGARVELHFADGTAIAQPVDGKSGYLSQSRLPLYFGLGGARSEARELVVVWPSGSKQVVPGPHAAGQRIRVVEP